MARRCVIRPSAVSGSGVLVPNAAPTVARVAASAVLVVAASLAGSGAAVAQPQPTEVTSEWVCETQPHRVTEFRIGDDTVAEFSISRFDPALGEFRAIEVTQSVDLISSMTIDLSTSAEQELIRIDASHVVWVNIPPALAKPNNPPTGTELDTHVVIQMQIAWADGIFTTGFSDLGTETRSSGSSFTSSDELVWAGSGSQTILMQSYTNLTLVGLGGNGTYVQETTAQAEVCYRYTFIPADVPDTPDPESDPDPESQILPDTGSHNLLPLGLAALAFATVGALLTVRRRHTTP